MGKKELKLNSLSRFSKKYPRLVLNVYDHCEVPAGCGGVVLIWTNPQIETIDLYMFYYLNGKAKVFLDGNHLYSTRLNKKFGSHVMEYGKHVLTFKISGFKSGYGLLICCGESAQYKREIVSLPDGSWKYSLIEPHDYSWMYVGFDDSNWLPMVLKPLPESGDDLFPMFMEMYSKYGLRDGQEIFKSWQVFGAKELGISEELDEYNTVWIRKEFSLVKKCEG